MVLADRAREVIGRHRLAAHLASVRELADQLEAAERTANELGASLAQRLTAEEANMAGALAAAVQELPPLGIVATAAAIERAARRHLLGRPGHAASSEQRRAIVRSLEALAESVLDTWAPGFDADTLRAVIVDESTRQRLAGPLAPLAEDPVLGFAPITSHALAARVATLLDNEAYRRARVVMAKEATDLDRALVELAAVRKRRRLFSGADEQAAAAAEGQASRERHEAFVACEVVASAFHQALASVPPLAIWLAAETLAALHSGAAPPMEDAVHLDGVTRPAPTFTRRAFVIDALINLRRAIEAAFPGLLALMEGDAQRGDHRIETGLGSPFRVAAITSKGDDASGANVAELMRLYHQADVPGMLRRGRVHALLAGAAGRSRANARLRVTALDRVAIWSDSLAETDERVQVQRADWHRAALDGVATQLATTIWPLGQRFHALRVRDLLVRLSLAIAAVKTRGDDFSEDAACPVLNKHLVYPVLDRLASELSALAHHQSLLPALHDVRQRLEGIGANRIAWRTRNLQRRYRCELFGFGELCAANHALARQVFAAIGEMPPDGLLLCHYVEELGADSQRR